ncbi:PREDICTED: uncharacterized protein LOC108802166 [Pelobates cultripes]|uniref:PREDICTED: uncharacterized protein LOC108802166 n=1 Tax=Pelobates cultripes TaxID=61616 RepID=A0AAD1TA82_PELCU|nr:PREDICTED: uncharacterized protein LOC108802166 [Pelobates cultripes]
MMELGTRPDWNLTSTGVGHDYRPHQHFPPCKSTVSDPLPPILQQPAEDTTFDELTKYTYETSTGNTYTRKYPGGILAHPTYLKAPALWKVHHNKDFKDKLKSRRPGLDHRNQSSEMKAEYQGLPAKPFNSGVQPFALEGHLNKGPSQAMVATTENKALSGEPFYIKDKGVLTLNDLYNTTTARDFRVFTDKELEGYAKKDALTYWQAEDYPKVWGHGLKENPLPKQTRPILRQKPPMQDTIQFPTALKQQQVPPNKKELPHRAFKSLAQESFQWPLDVKRTIDVHCPIECPWTTTREGPLPAIMSVPKMYKTLNETYGSRRPDTF